MVRLSTPSKKTTGPRNKCVYELIFESCNSSGGRGISKTPPQGVKILYVWRGSHESVNDKNGEVTQPY